MFRVLMVIATAATVLWHTVAGCCAHHAHPGEHCCHHAANAASACQQADHATKRCYHACDCDAPLVANHAVADCEATIGDTLAEIPGEHPCPHPIGCSAVSCGFSAIPDSNAVDRLLNSPPAFFGTLESTAVALELHSHRIGQPDAVADASHGLRLHLRLAILLI